MIELNKKFFKRMVSLVFFNFIITLILTGVLGFQVFIFFNLMTYGTVM